jgi:3-oxoacyl-[acyl-carrier protein] reductase
MQLGLDGKVALITGGAAGIGAAIAASLAREGCDVAIVDRAAAPPEATAEIAALGRRSLTIEADVRNGAAAGEAVAATLRALGGLDILICNAGITRDSTVAKMTDAQWEDVLDVNLTGAFNFVRAAAPVFRERKGGKIVAIASINGMRGKFGQANYAASKGGLIAMSKSVARELGRFGVNVNVVAPGMVTTEMSRGLPPEVLERARSETVLGRLATPDDCADMVTFLCSDRARHITGEVIQVDGGQYL